MATWSSPGSGVPKTVMLTKCPTNHSRCPAVVVLTAPARAACLKVFKVGLHARLAQI